MPCSEAGLGYLEGISTPKYDKQEEIYNYFFEELAACVAQLGTGSDRISGDVTSLASDVNKWKKYANSLRMRFAMRISDVNPTKAKEEFEKAIKANGGIISSAADDAYINYIKSPFTLYDGSRDLDFRVNALSEILYGQDPTSPTFVCSTLYEQLKNTNDPRLLRICRHYLNTQRSETAPEGCYDVTDEILAWQAMTTSVTWNRASLSYKSPIRLCTSIAAKEVSGLADASWQDADFICIRCEERAHFFKKTRLRVADV